MARSPCSHLISERKLKADVRGLRRLAWDDDVSVIVCRRLRPSSHVTRNSSSSRGSSPPPRLENEFFGRFRFRFLLRAPPARFPHPHRPTNSASSLPFDTPPVSISARLSTPHPLPPPPRSCSLSSSISGLPQSMGTNSMEDYAWIDEVAGESDGELQWTLDGFADLLPAPGYQNSCFPMPPLQCRWFPSTTQNSIGSFIALFRSLRELSMHQSSRVLR